MVSQILASGHIDFEKSTNDTAQQNDIKLIAKQLLNIDSVESAKVGKGFIYLQLSSFFSIDYEPLDTYLTELEYSGLNKFTCNLVEYVESGEIYSFGEDEEE